MASTSNDAEQFERFLLRRGVGELQADRDQCIDCGRTPLIGEHVHLSDGRAGGQADANRLTVLAVAHDLTRHGRLATQRAAELADEAAGASVVDVHVLPDQRRAPAIGALVAIGLQLAHAAPQQEALELVCVVARRSHLRAFFAARTALPATRRALARRLHGDPRLVVCPPRAPGS
jgi:hypothetical protein